MINEKEYFICVIAYNYSSYFYMDEMSCDEVYVVATKIVDEMVKDSLVLEDIGNGMSEYDAMRAFIERRGGVSTWY